MRVAQVGRTPAAPVRLSAGPYAALDFTFLIEGDDARLVEELSTTFASLSSRGTGSKPITYSVEGPQQRTYTLARDRVFLRGGCAPADVIEWLSWDVNRSAAEASSRYLLLHAAAVEHGGTGILLPGASGAGKSTTAAALVMDGFRYLTDELVALRGPEMLPFPKAVTLDRRSATALGLSAGSAEDRETLHLPADELGPAPMASPCAPRLVVFPLIDPSQPTSIDRLDGADAMLALSTNCVNLAEHGGGGVRRLAEVVEACRCYQLTVSDWGEACRLVQAVLP